MSCWGSRGIIVAADHQIEWLLAWWWKYYSLYNTYPVVFVDLGMSPRALKWCSERGALIPLDDTIEVFSDKVPSHLAQRWEKIYGSKLWVSREQWFKKPLVLQKTPFDLSLWIDVDCEICQSLTPIFDALPTSSSWGMVQESPRPESTGILYNSGVILYRKTSSLLSRWTDLCRYENYRFMGDQDALSHLILTEKFPLYLLPPTYNWLMDEGLHLEIIIAHWFGAWGKTFIRTQGGLHALLNARSPLEGTEARHSDIFS